ncbi:hypothetical protein [Phycicoccus sp. Soil748]|uniref:hypothetical protein n=1 Tax=Intrasporangiaceae TaxID=85021 RepID=UPI0007025B75|nr:hypothetical protein [Phycicoccus sp. Soil748]KRE57135.1 hypothetical protein ASG70_01525 [Phycicoccus sp. Soil748]
MSSPRNPLSLARRWTAGVLLASTLGAGAVGVHLAQDQGTTTAGSTGTSGSASDTSSSGSSSSTGSTGFSAVPGVSSGTGSAQTSTSGS